jgi:malate dehydrogenase (oxaloacetate-decarboxylating)
MTREEAFAKADTDIKNARELTHSLIDQGFIKQPPESMLQEALEWAMKEIS